MQLYPMYGFAQAPPQLSVTTKQRLCVTCLYLPPPLTPPHPLICSLFLVLLFKERYINRITQSNLWGRTFFIKHNALESHLGC